MRGDVTKVYPEAPAPEHCAALIERSNRPRGGDKYMATGRRLLQRAGKLYGG